MAFISEADVEAALLDQLEGLGYTRLPDSIAGPDGSAPERASYSEVVLMDRLKRVVDRLNPDIPSEARQDALKKIIADETPSVIVALFRRIVIGNTECFQRVFVVQFMILPG